MRWAASRWRPGASGDAGRSAPGRTERTTVTENSNEGGGSDDIRLREVRPHHPPHGDGRRRSGRQMLELRGGHGPDDPGRGPETRARARRGPPLAIARRPGGRGTRADGRQRALTRRGARGTVKV